MPEFAVGWYTWRDLSVLLPMSHQAHHDLFRFLQVCPKDAQAAAS